MTQARDEAQAQQFLEHFEAHANITKFFGKNPERSELETWLLTFDPNVRVILEQLIAAKIPGLVEKLVKRSEANGETVALLGPKLEKALRELLPKLRAGIPLGAPVTQATSSLNADISNATTSSTEVNPPAPSLFQNVTNAARNLFQTILPATNQNTENDLDNQAGRLIQSVLNEARKLETRPINHTDLASWPEIQSANPEMQSRIVVETIKYLTVSRGTWGMLLQQNDHLRTLLANIVNALLDRKLEFNTILSDRVLDYLRHPNSWHSSSIGLSG